MKFGYILIILLSLMNLVFPSVDSVELINSILLTYDSKAFYGIRAVMEYGLRWKYRDEEVYRYGDEKLVRVNLPENLVWFRNSQGYFLIDSKGNMTSSFIEILDLEDILLKILKSGDFEIKSLESLEDNRLLRVELVHKNQIFKFLVTEDGWKIIRIERDIPNLKTVLMYNRLVEISPQHFKAKIRKYAEKVQRKVGKISTESSKIQFYIENATKIFRFYMVNRFTIQNMKAIIIAGETKSGKKLSVVMVQGKNVKISLSNFIRLPEGYRVGSFYENGIKVFIISNCDEDEMKKIEKEIRGSNDTSSD